MSSDLVSLSSAGVPRAHRVGYWAGVLSGFCDHRCSYLHTDSFGAETLDGHIDYAMLSNLRLCQVEMTRHRVMVTERRESAEQQTQPVLKFRFQTHGVSVFEQQGRQIVIGPGDCLVYDISRPHVIRNEALTKYQIVMVQQDLLSLRGIPLELRPAQRLSRDRTTQMAGDLLRSILKEAPTLSSSAADSTSEALLGLLLLPFSARQAERSGLKNTEILRRRAKAFIEIHLGDPKLSIDQISAALGCTKRYLHMAFREEGTTISRYVWQSRIERCRRELENPTSNFRSITEVAFSWGFSSASHFSRLFKSQFGFAPSALKMHS